MASNLVLNGTNDGLIKTTDSIASFFVRYYFARIKTAFILQLLAFGAILIGILVTATASTAAAAVAIIGGWDFITFGHV